MGLSPNSPEELIKSKSTIVKLWTSLILILCFVFISFVLILGWQMQINKQLLSARDDYSQLLATTNKYESLSKDLSNACKGISGELLDPWKSLCNSNNLQQQTFAEDLHTRLQDSGDLLGRILGFIWIPILLMLFAIILVVSMWSLQHRYDKRLEKFYKNKTQKIYDRGYSEGLKKTVDVLNEDISVLRNISVWIFSYKQTQREREIPFDLNQNPNSLTQVEELVKQREKVITQVDLAASLFKQFLNRMETRLGLKQIGSINSVVNFDLQHHRTFERGLSSGDKTIILEPGWRFKDEVISKPLVGRDNGN